jgi:hypothetical protein
MFAVSWSGQIMFGAAAVVVAMWAFTLTPRTALVMVRRNRNAPPTRSDASRIVPLLGVILFLSAGAGAAHAQTVRYGVVMDAPMAHLDTAWSYAAEQVERAYCITNYSASVRHVSRKDPVQEDSIYRVWAVEPAVASHASPSSVDFQCADGTPELHVHTPSTCIGDDVHSCVAGGLNAFSCQPSRQDLEKLLQRGDPFAVIQCDRRSFRFYYPSEYSPGTVQQLAAAGGSSAKPDANVPLAMKKETKPKP